MKKVLSVVVLVMAVTVGLGACSSDTPRATPADRLAFYEAHAGDPVRSFRLFGRLNGWTPLGNSAMVVGTRPSEVSAERECAEAPLIPEPPISKQMIIGLQCFLTRAHLA